MQSNGIQAQIQVTSVLFLLCNSLYVARHAYVLHCVLEAKWSGQTHCSSLHQQYLETISDIWNSHLRLSAQESHKLSYQQEGHMHRKEAHTESPHVYNCGSIVYFHSNTSPKATQLFH